MREAWESFFARGGAGRADRGPDDEESARIGAVRSRHEGNLLSYPNVVGVAEGVRTRRGKPTGERCIVVYVQRKVPSVRLRKHEVIPSRLEGVPVDVVEVGEVEAL
jgi:hypothetical protein